MSVSILSVTWAAMSARGIGVGVGTGVAAIHHAGASVRVQLLQSSEALTR